MTWFSKVKLSIYIFYLVGCSQFNSISFKSCRRPFELWMSIVQNRALLLSSFSSNVYSILVFIRPCFVYSSRVYSSVYSILMLVWEYFQATISYSPSRWRLRAGRDLHKFAMKKKFLKAICINLPRKKTFWKCEMSLFVKIF